MRSRQIFCRGKLEWQPFLHLAGIGARLSRIPTCRSCVFSMLKIMSGLGSNKAIVAFLTSLYASCFKKMLIDWHPAKNQFEKGKDAFLFSYKSNAYAIDLAARPWAARKR